MLTSKNPQGIVAGDVIEFDASKAKEIDSVVLEVDCAWFTRGSMTIGS
jgi:hypothetical protein